VYLVAAPLLATVLLGIDIHKAQSVDRSWTGTVCCYRVGVALAGAVLGVVAGICNVLSASNRWKRRSAEDLAQGDYYAALDGPESASFRSRTVTSCLVLNSKSILGTFPALRWNRSLMSACMCRRRRRVLVHEAD
jgi:hypothetical protein